MKTTILISCLAAALTLSAAMPKSDVEKAVLAAAKAWVDAMIQGDAATLGKLLGDDLSYTHSSAKTETKSDLLKVISSHSTQYEAIDFTDTKVRQYGNVAVVTHKAMFRSKQSGIANLYVTNVWAKQDGGCQLVSRQATKLP